MTRFALVLAFACLARAAGAQAVPEPWSRPMILRAADADLNLWQAPAPAVKHKSPVLAWFLSWLVPGGGQAYNGQWLKAAAFFSVGVVAFEIFQDNGGIGCIWGEREGGDNCAAAESGGWLLVAASIGSQIDAPISAAAINRRNRSAHRAQLTLVRVRF